MFNAQDKRKILKGVRVVSKKKLKTCFDTLTRLSSYIAISKIKKCIFIMLEIVCREKEVYSSQF